MLSAEVERLTLIDQAEGLIVMLAVASGVVDTGALHERATRAFAERSPLGRGGWRIIGADIRVTFAPETENGRPKRVLVKLGLPNKSNLRDQTERHRVIARKLMSRWGLYLDDDR